MTKKPNCTPVDDLFCTELLEQMRRGSGAESVKGSVETQGDAR